MKAEDKQPYLDMLPRVFVRALRDPDDGGSVVETATRQKVAEAHHEIEVCQRRIRDAEEILRKAHQVAKLFGFTIESTPPRSLGAFTRADTVQAFVLRQAREAFPGYVRATALQEEYEALSGRRLHDKTVGVALDRLCKAGLVRREGRKDWYAVQMNGPDKADEAS